MDQDQKELDRRETKMMYYKMWGQLYAKTPSFCLSPYAQIVKELAMNPYLLEPEADIRTYRAFVEANGHCCDDPEEGKSSTWAAVLRQDGNKLYWAKQYDNALKKYNRSICAALNDSEDLALGYANRSAVFYEKGFYEVALVNIELAKKHNYPDRLMPKLLTRETNCLQKIEETALTEPENPSVVVSLEPNPKIPFLANGVRAHQDPTQGPIMLAEREFNAGDVILREKPMVACINIDSVFGRCNHCVSVNLLHLIPCPNCTWAMFCDEECMREGQKRHRFECGIYAGASKLNDFWMGPKLFFHGLTLFNDDVTKMMEFCKEVRGTESSFFDLDYSKYDPVAEFRAFLTAASRRPEQPLYDNIIQFNSAIFFDLCMDVPLVRSLITTEEQQDFMQQCFVDFQILRRGFTILQTDHGHLFPIASYFNHSCDPNTIVLESGNELRMIAQRPINRGDQIHFSYGPTYDQTPAEYEHYMHGLGFTCVCDFCDEDKRPKWLAKAKQSSSIDPADWEIAIKVAGDRDLTTIADKMNALQQFIQRYASCHPQEDYAKMVRLYSKGLEAAHLNEILITTRRKIGG